MASIDDGQVTLRLGEETYYLTPTIGATKAIGRDLGGLVQAMAKVQALDFDAMHTIVRHGLQPDDKLAKKLQGLLFRGGMARLISPLTEYLLILANGGQRPEPPKPDSDGEDEEEEGNGGQVAGA